MCLPKTYISSRIQKFRKGILRFFPLDGQIQWEVVVGTTNGDNLEDPSISISYYPWDLYYLDVYDISQRMRMYLFIFMGTTLYHVFHEIFSHHT